MKTVVTPSLNLKLVWREDYVTDYLAQLLAVYGGWASVMNHVGRHFWFSPEETTMVLSVAVRCREAVESRMVKLVQDAATPELPGLRASASASAASAATP